MVMRSAVLFLLMLGMVAQASAALTSRCYVRDGLIGMWDGEENAGVGVHDATSVKWADLSGHYQSSTGEPLVTLPDDAQVLDKSVQMTRAYGCPTNVPQGEKDNSGGSNTSGYPGGAFFQAFANGRYSFEVAYDMTLDDINKRKVFAIIGYTGWWFGALQNRYLGFNPNDAIPENWSSKNRWDGVGSAQHLRLDMGANGVYGQHVLSCSQDGATARISADGGEPVTMDGCSPTNGITTSSGFRINREYTENSGMNGKYHSIRIYDRSLTLDEVKINCAVDKVRFFGADADDALLPAGWYFDKSGGDVRLMRRYEVKTAAGGQVSVNGGAAAPSVVFDIDQGQEGALTAQLTAIADEGYEFFCWKGLAAGEDVRKPTGTFVVVGDVTAVFYKSGPRRLSARCYALDGLIGQWDGEENVAYGVHDATSTTWSDLTGTCVDKDKQQLVSLPTDAEVLDKGIRMTCQNGCPTNTPTGSDMDYGRAKYAHAAFLSAFRAARYSVEVAFDLKEDAVARVNPQSHMLIIGYQGWWFGVNNNRYLGFNPNDAVSRNWTEGKGWTGASLSLSASVDFGVEGAYGLHTMSCVQDGTDWWLSVDGTQVTGTCTPTNTTLDTHGFRINRGYYENSGMTGNYHAIRIYNRPLSADEAAVNQAVDKVRFFGVEPAMCPLPEGWRFETTDGIALERRYRVSSFDGEMGTVSVEAGEPAAVADAWVDVVTPTVRLTATPRPDHRFVGWTGGISGGDLTAAKGTFTLTGDVRAEFKKINGILIIVK
ncbi:MAG: hypothetical protein MJ240_07150 [Kiritimatiellae bacterium]|nr:hypothetical protein [Kiritimatiellia bacterium]